VLERLLGGDVGELVQRQLAERPAGGREPDGLDLSVRADAQALVDGVVLAVDGQDGDVALAGGGGEDFAGGHHALLVGQADGLAGQDGGVGGFEAGDADDGRDDEIRLGQGGAGDGACGAVDDFDAGDAGLFEARGELAGQFFGGQRDDLRPPADGLREGFVEVAPGGQRGDLSSGRETARRWRGCFGRWSRWNREWRQERIMAIELTASYGSSAKGIIAASVGVCLV
jgi:hypothetical protein